MRRRVRQSFRDDGGRWTVRLDCGHTQHLGSGFAATLGRNDTFGAPLECLDCEQLVLPAGLQSYRRTPEFDARTTPAGLRAEHRTKAGVWGSIHVIRGNLRYVTSSTRKQVLRLGPARPGIIAPQMPHFVEIEGPVQFYIEFLRVAAPDTSADTSE